MKYLRMMMAIALCLMMTILSNQPVHAMSVQKDISYDDGETYQEEDNDYYERSYNNRDAHYAYNKVIEEYHSYQEESFVSGLQSAYRNVSVIRQLFASLSVNFDFSQIYYHFEDIDHNGIDELFFGVADRTYQSRKHIIACYTYHDHKITKVATAKNMHSGLSINEQRQLVIWEESNNQYYYKVGQIDRDGYSYRETGRYCYSESSERVHSDYTSVSHETYHKQVYEGYEMNWQSL